MKLRTPIVATLGAILLAALLFQVLQRQLSQASFAFGAHPEVLDRLSGSLDDQKRLAELDPERAAEYRERFDRIESTLHRLQVLERSRADLVARSEALGLTLFALCLLVVAGGLVWRQTNRERRLERLRESLGRLAEGRPVLDTGESGRGVLGRIAAMIEETSRRMAGDRQRLAMLENLSAWQEAARRHAHEMRSPITGLRLELARLGNTLQKNPRATAAEIDEFLDGARQELDRLTEFTHRFSSFARLPRPKLQRVDLSSLLAELAEIYQDAWDNLSLQCVTSGPAFVNIDRDMMRQVLVNLWDNSSAAAAPGSVSVTLEVRCLDHEVQVDVADDGPGIAAQVSDSLFQPYTTTRNVGEGMGLGLAISKKILLDHGGDLRLVSSSTGGATFQLTLPPPEPEAPSARSTE